MTAGAAHPRASLFRTIYIKVGTTKCSGWEKKELGDGMGEITYGKVVALKLC